MSNKERPAIHASPFATSPETSNAPIKKMARKMSIGGQVREIKALVRVAFAFELTIY